MKKLIVLLMLSIGLSFAQESVESSESASADSSSNGESEKKSSARFFGEVGLIAVGAGVRVYVSDDWHQYIQTSLQYDVLSAGFIRLAAAGYFGGESLHGIAGLALNLGCTCSGYSLIHVIAGINYDLNHHVGFNLKATIPTSWPSPTATALLADVQLAF